MLGELTDLHCVNFSITKTSIMNRTLKLIVFSILAAAVIIYAYARIERISPLVIGHFEINHGSFDDAAINGYDVVSYFTANKAIKGDEKISHQYKDAIWYFSSEQNKNLFIAKPEKFIPQYGGYCSFAVGQGFTANTDPTSFEIIDGKLYLFSEEEVKTEWMSDMDNNIIISNEKWNED